MNKKDQQLIRYINKHYSELNEELKNINNDFSLYENNLIIQKAIKMDLFQIGELFGKLSYEIKDHINPKDVKGIIDIRNYIAHGYIALNDTIIWNTIFNDLPILISVLNSCVD